MERALPDAVNSIVSMHLLVLSAFRPVFRSGENPFPVMSQCTFWCSVLSDPGRRLHRSRQTPVSMHLLVLSAFRPFDETLVVGEKLASQCTFWCSVLSDTESVLPENRAIFVSMHLLVLSAFRHYDLDAWAVAIGGLNAPFGAQCFPTRIAGTGAQVVRCLNAPFGAQCFPTGLAVRCRR